MNQHHQDTLDKMESGIWFSPSRGEWKACHELSTRGVILRQHRELPKPRYKVSGKAMTLSYFGWMYLKK